MCRYRSAGNADRATTQAEILSVKNIVVRYGADGHSSLKPVIAMMNPTRSSTSAPRHRLYLDMCGIEGVRGAYSKIDGLATMVGPPERRAQVLVHESMHCRLDPTLLRYVDHDLSVANVVLTFSQSSADVMAILTVAQGRRACGTERARSLVKVAGK